MKDLVLRKPVASKAIGQFQSNVLNMEYIIILLKYLETLRPSANYYVPAAFAILC